MDDMMPYSIMCCFNMEEEGVTLQHLGGFCSAASEINDTYQL